MNPQIPPNLDDCYNIVIPKSHFSSFYSYLVGSKETEELVFPRPILVTIEDLTELNNRVTQKFATVDTLALSTTIFVSYTNLTRQEFGSWDTFTQTDLQTNEVTLEVIIKYDAMIRLKEVSIPQRHTLSVRIFTTPDLTQIIKTVMNSDISTEARIDHLMGPVVCRVEYLNRVIGKELANIVREWTDSRKLSFFEKRWIGWLKVHPNVIPTIFRFVTLLISLAILLSRTTRYFNESYLNKKYLFSVGDAEFLIVVTSGFFLLYSILLEINKFFSRKADILLKKYSLNSIVFRLTSGDTNFEKESFVQNSNTISLWIWTIIYNIAVNIIAGYLVIYMIKVF